MSSHIAFSFLFTIRISTYTHCLHSPKVHDTVEYFHDTSGLDVAKLAELIRSHGIHILLNWDGYSNNGVRATGLFPLQVAPLQMGHQV